MCVCVGDHDCCDDGTMIRADGLLFCDGCFPNFSMVFVSASSEEFIRDDDSHDDHNDGDAKADSKFDNNDARDSRLFDQRMTSHSPKCLKP